MTAFKWRRLNDGVCPVNFFEDFALERIVQLIKQVLILDFK